MGGSRFEELVFMHAASRCHILQWVRLGGDLGMHV